MAVAAGLFRRHWNLEQHLQAPQSHDLGKLLFGICLLTGGFFWAQWLMLWYGNLPEEIAWVIRRYYEMPYAPISWVMTYGAFIVPMVVLLWPRSPSIAVCHWPAPSVIIFIRDGCT